MPTTRSLNVDLNGNVAGFKTAMDQGIGKIKELQGAIPGVNNALGQMASVAASVAGPLAAGLGFKAMMDHAEQSERRMAKLEAVLKSTGSAAGITAQGMKDIAAASAGNSMFGKGETLDAMTRLASSGRIAGDQFKETITAAADMATVMGDDLTSASKRLGNALAEPSEGLQKLRREGVFFSDSQKRLIENFEKTNQLGKAQQVILDQLHRQFGGAAKADAETAAGEWKKLGETFTGGTSGIGWFLNRFSHGFAHDANQLLGGHPGDLPWQRQAQPAIGAAMPSQAMQDLANKTYEAADAAKQLMETWKKADFAASFGSGRGRIAEMSAEFIRLNGNVNDTAKALKTAQQEFDAAAAHAAKLGGRLHGKDFETGIGYGRASSNDEILAAQGALEAAQQKQANLDAALDAHKVAVNKMDELNQARKEEQDQVYNDQLRKRADAWRDSTVTPRERFGEQKDDILLLLGKNKIDAGEASRFLNKAALEFKSNSREPAMVGALLKGSAAAYDQAYKNEQGDKIDPLVENAKQELEQAIQANKLLQGIQDAINGMNQGPAAADFQAALFN
jgi:Prophage tail length tape measure protein